jgi:hypothetical protein
MSWPAFTIGVKRASRRGAVAQAIKFVRVTWSGVYGTTACSRNPRRFSVVLGARGDPGGDGVTPFIVRDLGVEGHGAAGWIEPNER